MFEENCKNCQSPVFLDNLATANSYNKETPIIIDEEGNPTINNLPDYVIMECPKCGTRVKKSFEQLIIELKYMFLKSLITIRQMDSYENIDRTQLREESGMSYCGMCPGPFDADGYCLNDLMKQCIVRKACLLKQDD